LSRPVALKALFPDYAREPSFVERFRREAQAAANLKHPNIVAIYDWGQESGTYFIVMEYVEGRSLRDLIRSEAPLDANHAAEITAEIASALAFAHRSGVVHRDVKPGNVLLTQSGTVKVTDFGIARAGTSDGLTQTGSVMGTATYFSPEQAQGLPVDGRSDVYSLGVVLYEMITGVPPFTGDSPVAVAYKHVREEPTPAIERNPEIPPDLNQIVATCLAKDPGHRYQTADDLRADLLRFRRGRPLAAAPVTAIVAEVPTTATSAVAADAYAATMATPLVDERGRQIAAPVYARKKKNTALITTLVILGLAVVIGLILYAAIKMGDSEGKVTVPDVQGKQLPAAAKELKDAHLTYKVVSAKSTRPRNEVIDQDPKGNAKATRNSAVKLTISTGVDTVPVPTDLRGKTEQEAIDELKAVGLNGKVTQRISSDTVDAGRVIDSTPPPGKPAAKGSQVSLIVSSGKTPVKIPPTEGMTPDQAGSALNAAGFQDIGRGPDEASDTIPAGRVIRTDPPAGQSVATTQQIKLVLSSGPAKFPVPGVSGQSPDQASNALGRAGWTVGGTKQVATSNPDLVGKVVGTDPPEGSQQLKSTPLTLLVGESPSPASSTTSTSTP
jgi:serine/threonine-protein kinase